MGKVLPGHFPLVCEVKMCHQRGTSEKRLNVRC